MAIRLVTAGVEQGIVDGVEVIDKLGAEEIAGAGCESLELRIDKFGEHGLLEGISRGPGGERTSNAVSGDEFTTTLINFSFRSFLAWAICSTPRNVFFSVGHFFILTNFFFVKS